MPRGIVLCAVLCLAAPAGAASAAPARTGFVPVPPERLAAAPTAAPSSRVIYLNRCEQGCVVQPGYDDSRTGHSSIIDSTAFLSPFALGDAVWNEVVSCVREMYAPFDIVVTETDPGPAPHFAALVAGTPAEAGFPDNYGGVAPFACGVIDNVITYTFANIWPNAEWICYAVAQETAHGFGLDHALLCDDPMTYLAPCGRRAFQDKDGDCGEDEPRGCYCGGNTQNSFRYITDIFGAGAVPQVAIGEPREGARVPPGFRVRAETSFPGLDRVELHIDGKLIASSRLAPFVFRAPTTLAPGSHVVELRAYDQRGVPGSSTATVIQDPCASAGDCLGSESCISGRCVPDPGNPGGLGEQCTGSQDCATEICGVDSSGVGLCAAACDPGHDDCPGGFSCKSSGDGAVCWPSADGGGCSVASSSHGSRHIPAWPALMVLALGLAFAGSRRP
jgi:hypothetical protein